MIAASLTLVSCDKGALENNSGIEGFTLQMTAENNYIITGGAQTRAEIDDNIEVKDFTVVVKNSDGETTKTWDKFSDVEPVVTLEGGTYMLEAYYGDMVDADGKRLNAAFNMPYYYGKQEFLVMPQATAEVAIECQLANIKTTVEFTERFLSFVEPGATVKISNGEEDPTLGGALTWTTTETKAGYFRVPENTKLLNILVNYTLIKTGESDRYIIPIQEVEARQWHKIKIDMGPESGGTKANLTINNELIEEEHQIEVPDDNDIIDNNGDDGIWDEDGEDGGAPALPTIEGVNLNGNPFDITTPIVFSQADASAKILDVLLSSTSKGGLQNLFLTIESTNPVLSSIFTGEMDLANPVEGSAWAELFVDPSIGIIDPAKPILGKKEHMFSVGGLMGMLGEISEPGDEHKFVIKLVDQTGATDGTLTIQYVE